jgi:hypothetical protein
MKIRTARSDHFAIHDSLKWSALDDDTYDGAEDSSNRHDIGYGATEEEAIADLMRLLQEKAEYEEDKNMNELGMIPEYLRRS